MKILDAYLTPGKEHGRPGDKITPIGITVHYVGNPGSSATGNSNFFESGSNGSCVSAHYIIDMDGTILQLIPENERANHAGKSYGKAWDEMAKTNNLRYIGIECCHPDDGGEFTAATRKALVELCVDICRRHGFNPRNAIVRHYDITGKECPRFYVRNPDAWFRLLADIMIASEGRTVNVSINGSITTVPAVFRDNAWYFVLANKDEIGARDTLEAMGYSVLWDAESNTIMAKRKED